MGTSYKYVKRDATNQINWAQVGADLNATLEEERRVRQEKKDAIDAATREYQKVLDNVPQGENQDLNGMALGFANDLQQQMMMDEFLLKTGQMDQREYTIKRQNLTDGTDQGFSLLQDYNNEYSKKMAMLDENLPVGERLSQVDLEIMANVEGFANFNNSKMVINPNTGMVSMANMIPDPNNPDGPKIPDPDPNNLVSVANLKNRIKTNITQYDVIGGAQAWTNTLGEDVRQTIKSMGTTYTAGTIQKITDITARKGGINNMSDSEKQALATELGVKVEELQAVGLYQEARNNWADSQIDDETFSGASVLMDFVDFTPDGKEYKTTFNPKDVYVNGKDGERIKGTENIILLKTENGRTKTELSDTQRNVAKRALETQANMQVDYKEEMEAERMKFEPRPKSESERKDAKLSDKQDNVFNNVAKLYYGNDAEVDEAIKFLRSTNPDITDIDRNGTDVIVRYQNGDQEVLTFGDQNQKQWVEGSANFFLKGDDKITDINKVSSRSKVDMNRTLNKVSTGYGGVTTTETEDLLPAYQRKLQESAPAVSTIFEADNENDSESKLATYVTSLPGLSQFSVSQAGGGATDALVVKNKEGEQVAKINLDLSTYDNDKQKFTKAMEDFMISLHNMSADALSMEDMALQVQGSRKSEKSNRGTLRDGTNNNQTKPKDRSVYND